MTPKPLSPALFLSTFMAFCSLWSGAEASGHPGGAFGRGNGLWTEKPWRRGYELRSEVRKWCTKG